MPTATLLQAAYGETGHPATPQALRTAPSGGALYPLELYLASQRVEGLEQALYHYDPLRHGLELLRPPVRRRTAVPSRRTGTARRQCRVRRRDRDALALTVQVRPRAYRFALLEAGHVAQSFLLAAEALGLAATPVGGFYDRLADSFVGVDGLYETTLYILPVGTRAA